MVRLSVWRLVEAVAKEAATIAAKENAPIVSNIIKEATPPNKSPALNRLPPLPSPKELLKLYKITAQRSLSQNFLLDSRLNNKIVTRTGNVKDCYVCEVGPGPGNITRCILKNGAKHVIVVEKDRRFIPSLQLLADACDGRLKLIVGDILDLNLENILPKKLASTWTEPCPPLYIIGNLPFSISTPLIIKWLRHCSTQTGPFVHGRTRLALTFQKEVGDRMVADVGTKERSRLTIMCQYLCVVEKMFTIPGKAFFPKPDVDVAVMKFTPRIRPLINHPFKLVEKLVTTIFMHRQKHCLYGVKNLFPPNRPELVEEMVKRTKIDPKARSYQLEIEQFQALCDVYNEFCQENDGLYQYNFQLHRHKFLKEMKANSRLTGHVLDDLDTLSSSNDEQESFAPSNDDVDSSAPSYDDVDSFAPSNDDVDSFAPSNDDVDCFAPSNDDVDCFAPSNDDADSNEDVETTK